ncbi:MAG: enoyl-CoA hydratase/isomerase family protein, partial [Myxococcota bacterium]
LLRGAPLAQQHGKRAIQRWSQQPLEKAAEPLAQELIALIQTEDAMEGISAFLEKKQPTWAGK